MRPDKAVSFHGAFARDPKELLDAESKGDQCGRRPDPGKHGSVVGEMRSVGPQAGFRRRVP
jgi:hypothetical protein